MLCRGCCADSHLNRDFDVQNKAKILDFVTNEISDDALDFQLTKFWTLGRKLRMTSGRYIIQVLHQVNRIMKRKFKLMIHSQRERCMTAYLKFQPFTLYLV